jgi:hypothetical protein
MLDHLVSLVFKAVAVFAWALAVVLVLPFGLALWALALTGGARVSQTQRSRHRSPPALPGPASAGYVADDGPKAQATGARKASQEAA